MVKLKKFVFVLMPFDKKFDDIYAFGIKQSCLEIGAYCERVDEQIFHERILDRIYNQIAKADIVVADMTDRNPNVFYEVGYAHGLGKNVMLLTQNGDDIPFDLKHFPHIIYGGEIKKLAALIKTKLEWFLKEATPKEISESSFGFEFLIDGQRIEEGKELAISASSSRYLEDFFTVKIDLLNSSHLIYRPKFQLGLEVSEQYAKFFSMFGHEPIRPSSNRLLYILGDFSEIYPQAYTKATFDINVLGTEDARPENIDVTLKVFTNIELKEISFKLVIPTKKGSIPW